jgi:hypothetical protein
MSSKMDEINPTNCELVGPTGQTGLPGLIGPKMAFQCFWCAKLNEHICHVLNKKISPFLKEDIFNYHLVVDPNENV